jgi:ATP/maltotriose-dependent transcriptional regulator MalT
MPQRSQGASGEGAAPSLLGSRLRAPPRPERYVRRPRLITLLDELVRHPVTLVTAPAGAGKTSLLVDWLSEVTMPVAWASLNETDAKNGQLWSTVTAALRQALPRLADHRSRTRQPRGAAEAVDLLLAATESLSEPPPTVLVLDDLQALHDADATMASLDLFLRSLPPWLHVVLVDRRIPHLPLDRLRSRGQLGELRFPELRFSPDEAEAMLSNLVPSLSDSDVEQLVRPSEGWAAGIQLTALAARSRQSRKQDVSQLGDAKLLVSGFVWHEVLAAERPPVIEVLMDTAVVPRMGPGLIHALTSQADPERLLDEAEERGLFVTRLDPTGWFEVHGLIREVLALEAERRDPGRTSAQHARAARWFEEADDTPAALDHWILAGKPRQALRVLAAEVTHLYDAGAEGTIMHALDGIPQGVAMADREAQLEYTWCLLLADRDRFLEAVEQMSPTTGGTTDDGTTFHHRLEVLRSISATITGDWNEGARLARRAIDGFGDHARTDWLGRFGWNMVARGVALSECWDDFHPQVQQARVGLGFDSERRQAFEGTRALGLALSGRPARALKVTRRLETEAYPDRSILRAERSVAEAIAYRELGDRQRAEAALLPLADATIGPVTYVQVLAQSELTRARLDAGDVPAAERAFDLLAQTVRSDCYGPGGSDLLARVGTLLSIAQGHGEDARKWAESVQNSFWQAISLARVHLAHPDHAAAREVLELAAPRSPRQEVIRETLRARAADSVDEAVKSLVQVVERATTTGMAQTVASEGTDVVDMLERMAWLAPKSWLDRLRRTASRAAPDRGPVAVPDVNLTLRELEILRMLPSRLTVPEIARELSISVNTVKFHMKMIYRKLGVRSRDEAGQVARAMRSLRGPH